MWKYPQKEADIHRKLWISTGGIPEKTVIHRLIHRSVDKFIDKAVIFCKAVKKGVNS